MLRVFVALPAVFCALAVKLNVPATVGVPEIVPELLFKLNPFGRLPPEIYQDIGDVPFAPSCKLYWLPTIPIGMAGKIISGG
jgi:hypothetical protein